MIYLISAITVLFCNGCSLIAPQNFGRAYTFTLSSLDFETKPIKKLGSLVVEFPKANAELDTYRIALLRDGGKRDYFAGTRWADFLPVVIQASMVETLQNSGYFSVVASDNAIFSPDYLLEGDITTFHADYTQSNPPTIIIKMHFTLIDTKTMKVIKVYNTIKKTDVMKDDIASIHSGFNSAFIEAQKDILGAL